MLNLTNVLAASLLGYLIGSFNTAVIVGKLYGKDISRLGSKNAGLTNTLRIIGPSAAIFVLLGDVIKAVVACEIGARIGAHANFPGATDSVCLLAAGTGAVMGHNWPIYFGFKGGKGALAAVAVLFVLDWRMAIIALGIFLAVIIFTRYVSLGTVISVLTFMVISFIPIFKHGLYFHIFTCLISLVVLFKHRANMKRLLAGTENKLAFRRAA